MSKAKCYNCKFGGDKFKIVGRTHLHCMNQELYPAKECEAGNVSPWETLREWRDTCDKHEFIQPNKTPNQ